MEDWWDAEDWVGTGGLLPSLSLSPPGLDACAATEEGIAGILAEPFQESDAGALSEQQQQQQQQTQEEHEGHQAALEATLDELLGLGGAGAEAGADPALVVTEHPAEALEAAALPPAAARTPEELKEEGRAHDAGMQATLDRIAEFAPNLPNLSLTRIEVVTMTVLTFINKKISFRTIERRADDEDVREFVDEVMHGYTDDTFTFEQSAKKSFPNCVTVRHKLVEARNNHTVKMFRTGKFHITGPVKLSEALNTSDIMTTLLDVVRGVPFDTHVTMDYDVEMINTSFRVGYTINLERALQLWRQQRAGLDASYDADQRKKALEIFYRSDQSTVEKVHIFCYPAGSVAISGRMRVPDVLYDAYVSITTFLDSNRALLELKHGLPPKPKQSGRRGGKGGGPQPQQEEGGDGDGPQQPKKGRKRRGSVFEYERFIVLR